MAFKVDGKLIYPGHQYVDETASKPSVKQVFEYSLPRHTLTRQITDKTTPTTPSTPTAPSTPTIPDEPVGEVFESTLPQQKMISQVEEKISPEPIIVQPITPRYIQKKIIRESDIINKNISLRPGEFIDVKYESKTGETFTHTLRARNYEDWYKKQSSLGFYVYEIKRQRTDDIIFRYPTQQQYQKTYEDVIKGEYHTTSTVPSWFKRRVTVPSEVRELGDEAINVFYRESYETSIGLQDMDKGIADLNKKIFELSTETWAKKYIIWETEEGKKTTWKELKEKEPALYLEKGKTKWDVILSPTRWQKEEAKKHKGDILWGIGQWMGETFSPEVWDEGIKQYQGGTGKATLKELQEMNKLQQVDFWRGGGYVQQARAKGHYEWFKTYESGDVLRGIGRALQSPFVLAPFSFGLGYGFSAGFRAMGGKAISLGYGTTSATTGGKVLGFTAKYVPKGLKVFAVGGASVDIGATAIFDRKNLVKKLGLYGLGFYSAGLGSRALAMRQPKVHLLKGTHTWGKTEAVKLKVAPRHTKLVWGKKGTTIEWIGARKYFSVFGKHIYYGKFHTVSRVKFTQQYTDNIKALQLKPYEPPGVAKPVFTDYKPMVKNQLVYGTQWGNKLFVETGQGWQPKIPLSLIVRPPSKPSIGLFDLPPMITESQAKLLPFISKTSWKPPTGLDQHPADIKDLDTLFKVYQKGKIEQVEYETLRDTLKKINESVKKVEHPLAKPKIKVDVKPKTQPIHLDVYKGILHTTWYGKTTLGTGKGWAGKPIQDKLIVRPRYDIMKPFKQFKINFIDFKVPQTGLAKHPSEIKDLDELFKLYRQNKITTVEYQRLRNQIRYSFKTTPGTYIEHPLAKPVFKPLPFKKYKVKPIKIEVDKSGLIKSEWYGKTFFEAGKGWQGLKKGWLSTKVFPKLKLYRAYETYFKFIIITKPPIIKFKPFTLQKTKHYTLKDIVKTDKDIIKDIGKKGGGKIVGGKTATIILEKPETILKTDIIKIKPPTDITTVVRGKRITVPEELQKPISKIKPIEKPKLGIWTEKDTILWIKPTIEQKPYIINPNILGGITRVDVQRIFKTGTMLQPDLQLVSISGFAQAQGQGQAQRVAFKTKYPYEYQLKHKPVFEKTRVTPPVIIKLPTPPITPISPIVKLPTLPYVRYFGGKKKPKIDPNQGYNVLVKDRMYVKGQKKYSERFIKLNKKPLNFYDAMGYGATVVDNSAARSFKIIPTQNKPAKPEFPITDWYTIQDKFYNRKKTNIEKTINAIDSYGEINEISARGWVADRRRMYKPIQPVKTIKPKKMKPYRFEPVDMRQVKPINLNVEAKTPEDFLKNFKEINIWGK